MKSTPCLRCGAPTTHPPTCDTCDRWIGRPPAPVRPEDEEEEEEGEDFVAFRDEEESRG